MHLNKTKLNRDQVSFLMKEVQNRDDVENLNTS